VVPKQLLGAEAKLARAQENLHALDAEIVKFFETEPYTSFDEFHPESAERGVVLTRVRVLREPPDLLGLIVGEAVHNLRCVFEYLVHELASYRAGSEVALTQYPMYGDIFDYRAYRRSKHGRWLKMLTIYERAVIQSTQPYRSRDEACIHPLAVLTVLSNQDKHRVLHTTLGIRTGAQLKIELGEGANTIYGIQVFPGTLKDGAPISAVTIGVDSPTPDVKVHPELGLNVAFENGLLVLWALEDIRVMTEVVFQELSKSFV
jgi:hypothetical protein